MDVSPILTLNSGDDDNSFLEIMHIGMKGWNAARGINQLILKLWCT